MYLYFPTWEPGSFGIGRYIFSPLHHHWKSQQSSHCWETWLFSFILQSTVRTQLAKPLTSNKEKWHFLILHGLYRNTSIILLFIHIHTTQQKKPSVDWLGRVMAQRKSHLLNTYVLNSRIFSQNIPDDWLNTHQSPPHTNTVSSA